MPHHAVGCAMVPAVVICAAALSAQSTSLTCGDAGTHGCRPTDKRIAELGDEWAFALANMHVTR